MNPCVMAGSGATWGPLRRVSGKACAPRQSGGCARRLAQVGFTLVELMIVVAIVAILAAIAIPSYSSYIGKTNRRAAEGCLSEYANYMERYYTTNLRYDQDTATPPNLITLPVLNCSTQTVSNYVYTFAATPTQSAFTVQAAPTAAQAKRETCGTLTLDQAGNRTPTTSGCW